VGLVNRLDMSEKTNCNYYTHDFKKKGGWVQTWSGEQNNVRYIQEMECTKCKITTYYPTEAFNSNGDLK